jgi:hypothetical protein
MVDYEQSDGQQIRGVRIQHWETTNKMKKPSQEANHFARDAPNSRCSTTYILTYLTLLCCLLVSLSHVKATAQGVGIRFLP